MADMSSDIQRTFYACLGSRCSAHAMTARAPAPGLCVAMHCHANHSLTRRGRSIQMQSDGGQGGCWKDQHWRGCWPGSVRLCAGWRRSRSGALPWPAGSCGVRPAAAAGAPCGAWPPPHHPPPDPAGPPLPQHCTPPVHLHTDGHVLGRVMP